MRLPSLFSRTQPTGSPLVALRQERFERIGTATSMVCAVHCALMPFLLALLPAVLGASLASGWVEWSLFGASSALGLTSMHRGKRIHGQGWAKAVFAAGLAMLALGRVSEAREWGRYGTVVLVLGGLTVAAAHGINGRLCGRCAVCHDPSGAAVK